VSNIDISPELLVARNSAIVYAGPHVVENSHFKGAGEDIFYTIDSDVLKYYKVDFSNDNQYLKYQERKKTISPVVTIENVKDATTDGTYGYYVTGDNKIHWAII
jgi:hypothetical protein